MDDDQNDSKEKTHSHSSDSDCSKELEQMFRRASLDYTTQVFTGLTRQVQDSDCNCNCKQYIAKSA